MPTFLERFPANRRRAAFLIVAAIQLASLAACGGGGGYGGGGMNAPMGTPGSKLFVSDAFYVASLVNKDPANGMLAPDRSFQGSDFTSALGLALDAATDRMYLGTSSKVVVYSGASMLGTIVQAGRVITGLGNPASLFIDTANNSLYVGDIGFGVKVFAPADMADGMAPAARTITGPFGTSFAINGVAVDPGRDILYVSNHTSSPSISDQITLFAASTATDPAPVAATITPVDGLSNNLSVGSIALDSTNNRLFVVGPSPTVMVFDSVSGLSGMQAATRTITLPHIVQSIAIDPLNDRLYATSSGIAGNFLYIVEGASTASGVPVTLKTLTPFYTNFTAVAVNPS
jgi:hypothetical protein